MRATSPLSSQFPQKQHRDARFARVYRWVPPPSLNLKSGRLQTAWAKIISSAQRTRPLHSPPPPSHQQLTAIASPTKPSLIHFSRTSTPTPYSSADCFLPAQLRPREEKLQPLQRSFCSCLRGAAPALLDQPSCLAGLHLPLSRPPLRPAAAAAAHAASAGSSAAAAAASSISSVGLVVVAARLRALAGRPAQVILLCLFSKAESPCHCLHVTRHIHLHATRTCDVMFVTRVGSESDRAEMRRLMLEAANRRQAAATMSAAPLSSQAATAGDASPASAPAPQLARPPSVNMIEFN
jgi:hypothetical protein